MSRELPKRACKECTHYDSFSEHKGFCRRYPPSVVVVGESVISRFPEVHRNGLCGEFTRLRYETQEDTEE